MVGRQTKIKFQFVYDRKGFISPFNPTMNYDPPNNTLLATTDCIERVALKYMGLHDPGSQIVFYYHLPLGMIPP